ncbi:PREDICTED: guanylate cyclase 2G-like [Priapulus caudatus]|uniref:Guanylate cyclase 2G-like n=1 Tax=Priapulus caudatus TaxID=37621 RepID=A0ABM1EYD4_PRICU|nr:PREDICTED: guanylate cyclase 2G-like [Priapulus caudatus]
MIFDTTSQRHQVYKVETIGDAYMVVSGLPIRNGDQHAAEVCTMALELREQVRAFQIPHLDETAIELRIGIHSGPLLCRAASGVRRRDSGCTLLPVRRHCEHYSAGWRSTSQRPTTFTSASRRRKCSINLEATQPRCAVRSPSRVKA